ncbi:hypothetical protein [Hymenobacter sp. UYP22]|uniref:hypothetical protein n=1 Tax=Hymenobacter sp. UYP22 TaxID=3156348 RepID=UPI0033961EC9
MRNRLVLWLLLPFGLLACGQAATSTPEMVPTDLSTPGSTGPAARPPRVALAKTPNTDTRYEYPDSSGNQVVIENSLPKGGLRYTAPNGRNYIYAVFWTRIVNTTATPFHLSVAISADSFRLAATSPFRAGRLVPVPVQQAPGLPDNYLRLVFPSEDMTLDKVPLFNYGLGDMRAVMSHPLPSSARQVTTVPPKATRFLYVVVLCNRGVQGPIRAGFRLQGDKLYYRVNGTEIPCGYATLKNVTQPPEPDSAAVSG